MNWVAMLPSISRLVDLYLLQSDSDITSITALTGFSFVNIFKIILLPLLYLIQILSQHKSFQIPVSYDLKVWLPCLYYKVYLHVIYIEWSIYFQRFSIVKHD